MEKEFVAIPRSLFERILDRVGIMSDTIARDIYLDLEKCLNEGPVEKLSKEEIKDRQIRFVDPFTFEIGEG